MPLRQGLCSRFRSKVHPGCNACTAGSQSLWRFPDCREAERSRDWLCARGTKADNTRPLSKRSTRNVHRLSCRVRQYAPIEDHQSLMVSSVSEAWPVSLSFVLPLIWCWIDGAANSRRPQSDPCFQIRCDTTRFGRAGLCRPQWMPEAGPGMVAEGQYEDSLVRNRGSCGDPVFQQWVSRGNRWFQSARCPLRMRSARLRTSSWISL